MSEYLDKLIEEARFGMNREFINPTHWMPLPEPPERVKESG